MALELSQEELLFAACAVQIGLVTPHQVARVAAKKEHRADQTLADLLLAEGVISLEQKERVTHFVLHELLDGQETVESLSTGTVSGPDGSDRLTEEADFFPSAREGQGPAAVVLFDDQGANVTSAQSARYTQRGVHAVGSQSRILVAFDEHIGREVAIKEFLGDRPGDQGVPQGALPPLVRFLREARITAQLEHPNIVPVHELGRGPDGTLYYTMRLVRGVTLDEKLRKCPGLSERLTLLGAYWDVAKAIAFAHSRGVVHRDIKPMNVMVGEFGETILLDWGVAKVTGAQEPAAPRPEAPAPSSPPGAPVITLSGTTIGTPGYMSPEQAKGKVDQIDERSDVWGLGAVLFEILTGRPPHVGATPDMTIALAASTDPPPVLSLQPSAPPELVAMVEKALHRDRRKRYQSARELAEDVGAYLTGGRVQAYGYSSWELLRKVAARNRPAFLGATLALLAVLGALVAVSVLLGREQSERRLASFHLAQAYLEKANRLVDELRLPAARVFAAAALLYNPAHPRSPFHSEGFVRQQPHSQELLASAASSLFRIGGNLSVELTSTAPLPELPAQLEVSPDGKRLAVACQDKSIQLWDLLEGRFAGELQGHTAKVHGVAFSPDGRLLASTSSDQSVLVWDLAQKRVLRALTGHGDRVNRVAFSPNGDRLASASFDGTIRLWSVKSGRALKVLRGHSGAVHDVAFSPDGRTLASAGADRTVRLWNASSGEERVVLLGHANTASRVRFSQDGSRLASGGYDGRVLLWDPSSGQLLASLVGHTGHIYSLAFDPDGHRLASGSFDTSVRFWDTTSGAALLRVDAHQAGVSGLAFTPDGATLASCSHDRTLKIWRMRPGRERESLVGHSDKIYALGTSPDGRLLASGSWDRTVVVWDRSSLQPRWTLQGHRGYVNGLAFSPDSNRLATTSWDETIRVWDLQNGGIPLLLRGHGGLVNPVLYSADGRWLLSGHGDREIGIWWAADGRLQKTLDGHGGKVFALALSPDGQRLASAGQDQTVRIWDPVSGDGQRVLAGHTDMITGLDWSPDGRWLASSGADRRAILWDSASGQELRRFADHQLWVNSVRFSPDSRMLATASDDRTVRLYSVPEGEPLLILGTQGEVMAVRFTPDGKTLLIGDDRRVRIEPLDFSAQQADPQQLLTDSETAIGKTLQDLQR